MQRSDATTKKQAHLVLSVLSVEKMKLAEQLVCHYVAVRSILTQENITYVILKDYNDYLKSVKVLKKD